MAGSSQGVPKTFMMSDHSESEECQRLKEHLVRMGTLVEGPPATLFKWMSTEPRESILGLVFDSVAKCKAEICLPQTVLGLDGNPVSLYSYICWTVCGFSASLPPEFFHVLETLLLENLLHQEMVCSLLSQDVWTFIGRCNLEICHQHCLLLAKIVPLLSGLERLKVASLLRRLLRFLTEEHFENFASIYDPIVWSHLWQFSRLEESLEPIEVPDVFHMLSVSLKEAKDVLPLNHLKIAARLLQDCHDFEEESVETVISLLLSFLSTKSVDVKVIARLLLPLQRFLSSKAIETLKSALDAEKRNAESQDDVALLELIHLNISTHEKIDSDSEKKVLRFVNSFLKTKISFWPRFLCLQIVQKTSKAPLSCVEGSSRKQLQKVLATEPSSNREETLRFLKSLSEPGSTSSGPSSAKETQDSGVKRLKLDSAAIDSEMTEVSFASSLRQDSSQENDGEANAKTEEAIEEIRRNVQFLESRTPLNKQHKRELLLLYRSMKVIIRDISG